MDKYSSIFKKLTGATPFPVHDASAISWTVRKGKVSVASIIVCERNSLSRLCTIFHELGHLCHDRKQSESRLKCMQSALKYRRLKGKFRKRDTKLIQRSEVEAWRYAGMFITQFNLEKDRKFKRFFAKMMKECLSTYGVTYDKLA